MPQIEANTDALLAALGFSPAESRRRSQTLADLVLAEWSAGARNKLNSTRAAYLRSLQVRDVSPSGFICGLPASPSTAIIAHMVEQGMGSGGIGTTGPYDVRKYLLQASTRNIRRRKDGGLYLHVPFYANTHPDAWMSSGITPRRIMDDVSRELPTLISQVY
jgi:hypothetical protein